MSIFDALTMLGGLCLFLFGMNIMGQALERRAGGQLQSILAKLTSRTQRNEPPRRFKRNPQRQYRLF